MKAWVGMFLLAFVCVKPLFAFDASSLPWNSFSDELEMKDKEFRGTWSDSRSWKGTLCNGQYHYDNQLTGSINTVDFDLQENGQVKAYADLVDIHTGLNGMYKSSYTACVPLRGWYGVGVDRAQIRATITFIDHENDPMPEIRVRIHSTELGHIRLGSWVPTWLENVVTNVANAGLKRVWGTFLGTWISDKISKQIKKLPAR